jgi:hypothetical protein
MPVVEIGLKSAKESFRDERDLVQFRPVPDARVLEVRVPDDASTGEAFRSITDSGGVVAYHTDEAPAWVHCEEKPGLASLLAEHFGCANGKPDDVEDTHWTLNGPPGVGPQAVSEAEGGEV